MLKKRLSDSKAALNYLHQHDDLVDVLGGRPLEAQFKTNMRKDIEQLEYLLECLDNKYK